MTLYITNMAKNIYPLMSLSIFPEKWNNNKCIEN